MGWGSLGRGREVSGDGGGRAGHSLLNWDGKGAVFPEKEGERMRAQSWTGTGVALRRDAGKGPEEAPG